MFINIAVCIYVGYIDSCIAVKQWSVRVRVTNTSVPFVLYLLDDLPMPVSDV